MENEREAARESDEREGKTSCCYILPLYVNILSEDVLDFKEK